MSSSKRARYDDGSSSSTSGESPNMFGGPMAGPNQGMDILPMSSPQVGQGMHQQSLNNVGMNMVGAPRAGGMDSYPGSWSNNDNRIMQHNPGMNNPSSMMGLMGGSGRPGMEQQMQPMQGTQSWHQDVSPDLRQHLVRKLVTTIYPVQDQNALQDRRVMSLIQYAKKVEKSMFEVARSREQYYELLAEKIYKIQKELEERRNRMPNRGMMAVGTDYDMGSDPALWPPQGPMQGMASGGGAPYPMNRGTPFSQGDVSGYPGNQPQRTPMMVPSSPNTQLDTFLSGISSPGRPPSSVLPPPSVPGIPPSPANERITGGMFDKQQHNQSDRSIVCTCNACHMHIETRYHCSECEDFDLCVTCYHEKGHEHKMEKLGLEQSLEDDNQTEPRLAQNPHEARKQSIQKYIQSLVHACRCRDMSCELQSCIKMKKVIRHTRDCRKRNNGNCSICKQFVALCLFHARSCNENQCSVPLCSNIKQKYLKKQHIEHQIHQDHRAHSSAVTPSAKILSVISTPVNMASLSTNTNFGVWHEIEVAFNSLTEEFVQELSKSNDVHVTTIEKWCRSYYNDTDLSLSIFSVKELFDSLKSSSFYNFLSTRFLKHLANKSGKENLKKSVTRYEEKIAGFKLQDISKKKVNIVGEHLSKEDAELIYSLLQDEVTLRQLQHIFIPKWIDSETLTLDCGTHLPEFYSSFKDDKIFLSKAKQENQVIDFQHIKILLTGSAAVGKTSFCRLLFGSKFFNNYESTEVLETKQAISIMSFSMLKQKAKQESKEVVWLKLDPKNQRAHFRSLLKDRVFHQNEIEMNQEALTEALPIDKDISSSNNAMDASTFFMKSEPQTDVETKILSNDPLGKNFKISKDEVVKLITVIDTGGQPQYIHMLPTINNSPTVNFVVLDMTKDLDAPVMVQHKSKHNKNFTEYPLHYSNWDMIGLLMSLTTDSLEQPTKPAPSKTRISIPKKSFIGFVGTHKDKLEEKSRAEKIATINKKLTCLVGERKCEFAVIPAEKEVLFPVDNTTAGTGDNEDLVVKELRQKIENLMNASSTSVDHLPITWMILELELQELHEDYGTKYITCEDYVKIATEKASVDPEEVKESLQRFDYLGVFLHFEKVKGLCDYVIIDHQWLFDSLAYIMHLSSDDIDFRDHYFKKQFDETRLLAKSELCYIDWRNELCLEYFFNLLIYLKVIATVTLSEMEYYYMPCILPSTKQYNDKYIFPYSAPLLVQFSSGFLPRGFFCSLVVHLLQNLPTGWDHQLHNTEHFSNVITFRLPDKSFLRLHDKTSYLEIQVRHHTKELTFSYHSKIFPKLSQYFRDVCKKLNFNHEKLQYGFLCHDGKSNDDHIAVIKPFEFPLPPELECCRKCPHLTKLGKFHKIWFETVDETVGNDNSSAIKQLGIHPAPDAPYHNDKPKMWDLIKIVIPMIKAKWTHVAYSMQYDAEDIEGIEKDSSDSAESCERLFKNWLASPKGITKTWRTLLNCIKDVDELAVTAENIDTELSAKYNKQPAS